MTTIEVEQFLPGEGVSNPPNHINDHLCIRFIRKKYICLLMFFFAIMATAQAITLIITNMDKNILQQIDDTITSVNITQTVDSLRNLFDTNTNKTES